MYAAKRPRPPPLRNLVIATNPPPSEQLKSKLESLGAVYSPTFHDGVTHFVCDTGGGADHRLVCKHNARLAMRDRVIIVKYSWLEASVSANLNVSHLHHILPPFTGMVICCSGLEQNEKITIQKIVNELGGKYARQLSTKCSHLICRITSGEKYEFARTQPAINVVQPKWIHECSRHNALIDESPYSLIEERQAPTGTGTQVPGSAANPSSGNTHTEPIPSADVDMLVGVGGESTILDGAVLFFTTCPLRDQQKYAPLKAKATKLAYRAGATVSTELSFMVNYVVVIRLPVTSSLLPLLQKTGALITTLVWLEKCLQFGRLLSTDKYPPPSFTEADLLDHVMSSQPITSSTFQGMRVCLSPLSARDATIAATSRDILAAGRAKVLPHDASGFAVTGVPTHVVCGEDIRTPERTVMDASRLVNVQVVAVTAFWVEMCAAAEKLIPVNKCVLFSPVPYQTPLKAMQELQICVTISGFQQHNESDWNRRRIVLRRVAIVLGARYSERMLRRSTTHLIADDRVGSSDKVVKAHEWDIKVVNQDWLLACAHAGKVVGAEGYPVVPRPTKASPRVTPKKQTPRKGTPSKESDHKIRRSPRIESQTLSQMPDAAAINLFQRFASGFGEPGGDTEDGEVDEEMHRARRSRSVSRDAVEREWSMDASQSQVIMHRDLTPPGSPGGAITRSNKRARDNL